MEKYSRILIIIFFLTISNIGLSIYILSKINKTVVEATPLVQQSSRPQRDAVYASPVTLATTAPNIQSDLTLIKAEIRALRNSLESTGLIITTPEP